MDEVFGQKRELRELIVAAGNHPAVMAVALGDRAESVVCFKSNTQLGWWNGTTNRTSGMGLKRKL